MKKYVLVIMLLMFAKTTHAEAPTLESLKADLTTKTQQMDSIKKNLTQLEQRKQNIIQSGLTLQGELAYIQKMIAEYEKPVVDKPIAHDLARIENAVDIQS